MWYTVKLLRIRYNLFAGTETLSLSVYKPIAMQILLGGRPQFWVGVELGGRVWYTVKVLHIRLNLFAGTETLSLSAYEPIAMQILLREDRPPILGEGVDLGARGWYYMKAHHNGHKLPFETDTLSRFV